MLNIHAPGGRLLMFGGIFSAVSIISWHIASSQQFSGHAEILSIAMAVDMAIVLPSVYYLLIRHTAIPPLSTAFIFLVSVALATTIIPENQEMIQSILMVAPAPIELLIIGFIAYKARKIVRLRQAAVSQGEDSLDSLRAILRGQIGNEMVADILTTEISIIAYALSGWNRTPQSEQHFTYHRKTGYTAIAWAFVLVIAIEAAAVHFVVMNWSHTAAWVFTALSAYSLIFLFGDLNAIRLRPVIIDDRSLHLRVGLRWNATIPLDEIESVELLASRSRRDDIPSLRVIGDPNILLRFRSTQRAIGLYGFTKSFDTVQIAVDEKDRFVEVLKNRISA